MTAKFTKISDIPVEHRPRGSMPGATYDLTPGRSYLVVAMELWEHVLNFLTQDDSGIPSLVPASMFDQGKWEIPPTWFVRTLTGLTLGGTAHWESPSDARWGYKEYVDDEGYINRLFENAPQERDDFNRRYAQWFDTYANECRR